MLPTIFPVFQVGEKTALKLLHQFETVENLLQSIDEVSGQKLKEKIEEHRDLTY